MTTITGPTSLRGVGMQISADDTVFALAWFALYLAIVGLTVSSEMLTSAIEVVGLH